MYVLVTGGAGYIGSHAVYQLIENGYNVVVIDNLSTGHRSAIHPKATYYQGDIRNIDFVKNVFEKEPIQAVFHFAANSLVGESTTKPLEYFDNNVYGTQVILQVMQKFSVDKIIFSSTAAVYGEPNEIPIKENHLPNPTSPYGETKLTMEKMMKWAYEAHGIQYVSLRYFNVAGARTFGNIGEDHRPETHLIPIVLQTALGQRENVTIFGNNYNTADGTCIRDYIHVEDLIDAHILALRYLIDGGKSDIFNLGSNEGFSVKEIINTAKNITGKEIQEKLGDRRAGDPSVLIANPNKAIDVLGWNPTRSTVEQMIQDAWNWHVNHPNGYVQEGSD